MICLKLNRMNGWLNIPWNLRKLSTNLVCKYCALPFVRNNLRYTITRRVLEVWQHELPVKQAPACPAELSFALAAALVAQQPGVAAASVMRFTVSEA